METYRNFEKLDISRDGEVLTVRMTERCHAQHTELSELFTLVRADNARVLVLTGVEDTFLGPVNAPEFVQMDEQGWQRVMREARWIVRDMLDLPQPIVVAMNGDAIGLGASLVSFGDFVVAAEGTKIGESHIAMGIAAGDGGATTLPFLLGWHRAKRLFLLDETIPVEELRDIGMVTRVVPLNQLSGAVAEVVNRLLSLPDPALRWTKLQLNQMMRLAALVTADVGVAHEGWSWHLEPARVASSSMKSHIEASQGGGVAAES